MSLTVGILGTALLSAGLSAPSQAAPSQAAPLPYGQPSTDPYETGFPSSAERELHLWTNAVRVDPEAFSDEYASAGCSFDGFTSTEQIPHDPLYLDMGLAEAARFHSADMAATGNFSHDSSDGTPFATRIAQFYDDGVAGENIAWNYDDPFDTVLHGWMCSSGHRANIMTDYTELGTGIVDAYDTQDFGGGAVDTRSPVAMGAHTPQDALSDASFMADWLDEGPPSRLLVVVDGVATDLALTWGEDVRGVYTADLVLDPVDCHVDYFRYETGTGVKGTFPERGSYTFGDGCTDGIGWVDRQTDPDGGLGTPPGGGSSGAGLGWTTSGDTAPVLGSPSLVGCSAVPGATGLLLGLFGALGAAWRRRTGSWSRADADADDG